MRLPMLIMFALLALIFAPYYLLKISMALTFMVCNVVFTIDKTTALMSRRCLTFFGASYVRCKSIEIDVT
jgi:hypothetical protein